MWKPSTPRKPYTQCDSRQKGDYTDGEAAVERERALSHLSMCRGWLQTLRTSWLVRTFHSQGLLIREFTGRGPFSTSSIQTG